MRKLRMTGWMGGLPAALLGTQMLAQVGGPIQVIHVPGTSAGKASSDGILTGGTLYIAGQNGRKADGSTPADAALETVQALSNIRKVLQAAGMDYANLAWINIYVVGANNLGAVESAYWKTIGMNPPARSVQVVGSLAGDEKVEINGIASMEMVHRKVIHPTGWPQGPGMDPPGIQINDVLYMSAMGGVDPATGKMAADYLGEVKQALDNVATILKTAGMTMKNVIWVNPFSSVGANTGGTGGGSMNQIYASYFEFGNTPGRATITMEGLPKQQHFIAFCIAGADLSKRHTTLPRNMVPSPTASPGIVYDDTYYMSAKSAFIPDLGLITPDVLLQVRLSMRNLLDDLQYAPDMDFSDVVFSTAYLADIHADEDRYLDVYATFFKNGRYPALTVLQQTGIRADDGSRGNRPAAPVGAAAPAAGARQYTFPSKEQISFIAVRQPK
jgi:enamine deaminase RidA (YjgF/YER057c/UK114 family)